MVINEKGQSLVEVLIAVLVVTLVLTAIVVSVLVSLKSVRFSQHKSRAAFLGQEGIEWVRGERQGLGWGEFVNYASETGANYCLETLETITEKVAGECGDLEVIDGIYERDVLLAKDADSVEVAAEVKVEWFEGENRFASNVSASFNQWETVK
jgi:hypothetical protein